MSTYDWVKVDFQDFINKFNKQIVIEIAPTILYTKKDKEHEAINALIAFFFISGFLLIYISVSILISELYFSIIGFIIIIIAAAIADLILLLIYIRSNVAIKPLESWVEIYESIREDSQTYYCFSYYIVFSGKCLLNRAKNVVYKLYQEELLKSKLDITQIEVYLRVTSEYPEKLEKIGYYFQYGEGKPFKAEDIDRNSWKFFPYETSANENYLAIANWDHQYEWRNDLELDYDKLHDYAPWVIKTWNEDTLKPLTEDYKISLMWELRQNESIPKLKPWFGNIHSQSYENFKAYKDLQLVNEVIEKIIGNEKEISKLKDLKGYLFKIKAYFRDLKK